MKHAQKMVMIPEHLMQIIETEHRLMAPAQLTTDTFRSRHEANHGLLFPRRSKSLIAGSTFAKVPRVNKTNEK